jgi:hypothetical protein
METSLYDRLDEPQTFEEMTVAISHPDILQQTHGLLSQRNCDISKRIFLACWLISRFPEAICNTPDQTLKATADAVVLCCKSNHNFTPVLDLFKNRFNTWKGQDVGKLKDELMTTYAHLRQQQLDTPESADILEHTKTVILLQARKIGGESFVEEVMNNSNSHK